MCKSAALNLVDLVKSFQASIYLQISASIQPRMSLSKFAKCLPKVRIRVRKNIGAHPQELELFHAGQLVLKGSYRRVERRWSRAAVKILVGRFDRRRRGTERGAARSRP